MWDISYLNDLEVGREYFSSSLHDLWLLQKCEIEYMSISILPYDNISNWRDLGVGVAYTTGDRENGNGSLSSWNHTPSRGDTSVNLAFVASGFILFGFWYIWWYIRGIWNAGVMRCHIIQVKRMWNTVIASCVNIVWILLHTDRWLKDSPNQCHLCSHKISKAFISG